jgi:hypothetical protein
MPARQIQPKPSGPMNVVEMMPPCKCGCTKFREANRINQVGGGVSVMFECVECGEYRL